MSRGFLVAGAIVLLTAALLQCGTTGPLPDAAPGPSAPDRAGGASDRSGDSLIVHVVSHGWHAGIVVRPRTALAEIDLPRRVDSLARTVEVGWGDEDYYRSPDPGVGITLEAGLWPTRSAIHVVGLREAAADRFPGTEIVRFALDSLAHRRLEEALAGSFERDRAGAVIPLGPGLYEGSRFFAGRGRYHVFNNCNHWTARMLRAAGVPVRPRRALTEELLMRQLREAGTVVRRVRND